MEAKTFLRKTVGLGLALTMGAAAIAAEAQASVPEKDKKLTHNSSFEVERSYHKDGTMTTGVRTDNNKIGKIYSFLITWIELSELMI